VWHPPEHLTVQEVEPAGADVVVDDGPELACDVMADWAGERVGLLGVSERCACRVTGQSRGTQRRPLIAQTPADPDAALLAWLRAYARAHPRWGFRRAYHDARGEGWMVNHKKIQGLWREEG
jgi:hypothetical protein